MKLQVSVKYIDVKKRTLLTCEGFQMMAWELVKHLLYMRNQIPNLYEDLHWQVQVLERNEELQRQANHCTSVVGGNEDLQTDAPAPVARRKPKRRLQTSQKRLRKFVNSAESMMSLLTLEAVACAESSHLVITLGSTPSRPLELYSIGLPTAACRESQAENGIQDLIRRTIRSLVMNTQDMPEGRASAGNSVAYKWHAGPTKLFILLHGHYDVAPPGFTFKRDFQIRMRKGTQVHINLTDSALSSSPGDAVLSQPAFLTASEEEFGLRWYQCQIAVKGLRHPGNRDNGASG